MCAPRSHRPLRGAATGLRAPAASWRNPTRTPRVPPPALVCSPRPVPRGRALMPLPPAGLASSPGTSGAWPPCRAARTARSPSASGPAPTGTTASRSKDRRPCSTCEPPPARNRTRTRTRLRGARHGPGGPGSRPRTPLGSGAPPSGARRQTVRPRKHAGSLAKAPDMRVDRRPSRGSSVTDPRFLFNKRERRPGPALTSVTAL